MCVCGCGGGREGDCHSVPASSQEGTIRQRRCQQACAQSKTEASRNLRICTVDGVSEGGVAEGTGGADKSNGLFPPLPAMPPVSSVTLN